MPGIEFGPYNVTGDLDGTTAKFRHLFVIALRESTPEVLESLRKDVLPVYIDIRRQLSELRLEENREIVLLNYLKCWSLLPEAIRIFELRSVLDLGSALARWAMPLRLKTEWFLDYALRTLDFWNQQKQCIYPLDWFHSELPRMTLLSIAEQWFECRIARTGYDPADHSPAEFKREVFAEVERHLDRHIAQVDALYAERGGPPRIAKRNKEHFNWLALRLVRRLTYSEIAARASSAQGPNDDVSEDTVCKGVKAAAKLLEPRLRPGSDPIWVALPVPPVDQQPS